jgi:hypothetical protein
MRHPVFLPILCAAALAGASALAPLASHAQQRQGPPPAGAPQPPPLAAVKPYKAVNVTPPKPMNDPSLEAFRKQIAEIARKKDRAALAKLVAQDFFWEAESGNKADKKKSGIDNLAVAIGLDAREGYGWDALMGHAADPTADAMAERKGVVCSPADPQFNEKELEDLIKTTGTDPGEWAFPVAASIEARAEAKPNAPVVEKLGAHFVRVLPMQGPPPAGQQVPLIPVATPSGKTAFVPADALAPLGSDQICYVKDGNSWKIAGYVGGGH